MLRVVSFVFVLICLTSISCGQSTESSQSVSQESRMEWFRDAKFGMFVHWGGDSQAAGEWNGKTDHHEWLQLTAKIPLAEYTDFAKKFNPQQFDANQWVKIAKDAGMK